MFDILKDIRSGALPISEIPGFIVWGIGKTFWVWFIILLSIVLFLLVSGS